MTKKGEHPLHPHLIPSQSAEAVTSKSLADERLRQSKGAHRNNGINQGSQARNLALGTVTPIALDAGRQQGPGVVAKSQMLGIPSKTSLRANCLQFIRVFP